MFKNYLRTAFRNIFKNRVTSFINLFGLSVGMTAAVFIFLWVKTESTHDDYHPDAKNIYRITNAISVGNNETWVWDNSPFKLGDAVKNEIPEVKSVCRISQVNGPRVINFKNKLFKEKNTALVDSNWFRLFKYQFINGNAESFNSDPYGLVMTASKAKKYFGDKDPVGQIIKIDTSNYTVQGVVNDNPVNSSFQFDIMMQMGGTLTQPRMLRNNSGWGNFNYITFVKLNDKTSKSTATAKINAILNREREKNNDVASLVSLPELYFESNLQSTNLPHGNRKTVYIFTIMAVLLLITACINYVNLTTARASLRAREVGVRKIVGAQRKHLFLQFIVESIVFSIIALLATLILVQLLLPLFNDITEKHFVSPLRDTGLWQILFGTLFVTTILNGIYPAALLSSFNPMNVFRGKSVLRLRDASLRKVLVVFQFVLSSALIIGTIIIYSQLKFIQHSDPGYNLSQVISLEIPYQVYGKMDEQKQISFFNSIRHELKESPAVQSVCTGGEEIVDVSSYSSGNVGWEGRDTTFEPTVSPLSVDEEFQKLFQIQLRQGRWFRPGDEDAHNFVLNETAVSTFTIKKPVLGQVFSMGGDTGRVIGIVKDFHYQNMHEKIGAMVMRYNYGGDSFIFIKTAPGSTAAALQAIEKTWNHFISSEPFQYKFLDERFMELYKSDTKISQLMLIFSIIAIIIAALGLFGLATFTTEQRIKEIGIRKVLGAGVQQLTLLLTKDFVKLVIIALLIASPLAWYFMNKWLSDFAYRINITWWMFVLAALFAILIAVATVGVKAIKAALQNPVKSLKTE